MEKTVKSNCLLCNKKFDWNEIITWKLPENVWFCKNCIEKFEDNNIYKGINTWMVVEYEPWTVLEYKK